MVGVGGTADEGVSGCGIVAEAGVRARPACDCLRLFDRGSGVFEYMKSSSCSESGVGNRTAVNIFGTLEASGFADTSLGPPAVTLFTSLLLISGSFS